MPHRKRPGYMTAVTLVAVLALTMTVSAIAIHFKESVRAAADATEVAIAQLQVLYLAEMGINAAMFKANLDPSGPHPVAATATFDLKSEVALTRDDPAGEARVVVGPAAPGDRRPPFEARATLRCAAGTYSQVVYFDVGRAAEPPPGRSTPQWTLTRYVVAEMAGRP